MTKTIDSIDLKILGTLQREGRLSIVDLAKAVNLTKTPCSERVKRMERSGIIREYRAIVSPAALGLTHETVVHVNLTRTDETALDDFNAAVAVIPEVETCMMIAGPFDYMLKVRTRDMAHFRQLMGDAIGKLPGVMQTHSFAVMQTVKDDTAIAISANEGREG